MPDDLIAVRPTLLVRVMRAVGLLPSGEVDFEAGADYSAHDAADPQYPKSSSMSAFAAFPWVYACVDAIAADLSGLPLRVIRGTGDEAEVLDSHPVLELLANPSSRVSPTLFRRQLVTDYVLTGDAYALVAGESEPQALLRLAPQRVRVVPWTDGQPGSYEYNGAGGRSSYDYQEILHLRSPSWEEDPSSLYGTGAIRPLDADLRTEQAAVNSAASTAKIGRPSGIISPSEDGDRWSSEQIARMRGAYEKQLGGKSGVLFLGGSANFQQLAWSPRDLEFVEQRRMTRESVLAVFSVPPTRVGLPSANYATAKEQSRMYWTSLIAKAAMIDAELTRLAQAFPNSENVRVIHDFAAVEALQESRTDRVHRVHSWWQMGLSLQDAATVEGFEEIPDAQELLPEEAPPEPEEDVEAEEDALRALTEGYFQAGSDRSEALSKFFDPDFVADEYPVPETREERLAVWKSYIDRLHGPAERLIRARMDRFLTAQKRRYVNRIKALARKSFDGSVVRTLTDRDIEEILDELEEAAKLQAAATGYTARVTGAAFATAAKQLGVRGITWDPIRRREMRDSSIARMVAEVQASTVNGTRAIVLKGLSEGLPAQEIAKLLEADSAGLFTRARAMRIARTETTRLTNAAALASMDEAAEMGFTVYKMWATAGDNLVRDEHLAMDGKIVDHSESFVSGLDGRELGQQPGTSGSASSDVNCRCTLLSFIERSEADAVGARRTERAEEQLEERREESDV
jgi:HK97 family phage portal protein